MADDDSNYFYDASLPAAALFAALFGLSLIAHAFQLIKGRLWWFIPFFIAVAMEFIGYVFRILAIKKTHTLWVLIVSEVCIVVAPAFLAAADYMLVGRMMSYVGSENSPIGHTLITKIFVVCDVLSILAQAAGASSLNNGASAKAIRNARYILIGSLSFQAGTFSLFVILTIIFHAKAHRNLGEKLDPLRPLFLVFYISAALIISRSIYRTVDFSLIGFTTGSAGPTGYTLTHEWLFYVFDSLPIVFAVCIFHFLHPKNYLPRRKGLRIDGSVEVTGPWWRSSSKKIIRSPSESLDPSVVELGQSSRQP